MRISERDVMYYLGLEQGLSVLIKPVCRYRTYSVLGIK